MTTPRWRRFLPGTFGEDADGREVIDFLHLPLDYSITGDARAPVMPFLRGEDKNGKAVPPDAVIQILGGCAGAAPPGLLMERGAGAEHSTELTEPHDRSQIVCSELRTLGRFDAARVRLLTGGDRIRARRIRQDYLSFALSPTPPQSNTLSTVWPSCSGQWPIDEARQYLATRAAHRT